MIFTVYSSFFTAYVHGNIKFQKYYISFLVYKLEINKIKSFTNDVLGKKMLKLENVVEAQKI